MRVIITWIKCARLAKEIRGDSWVGLEGRIQILNGWICSIICRLISILRVGHNSFKLFCCSRSHESSLKPWRGQHLLTSNIHVGTRNSNLNMHCTGSENNVKQMVPHRQFPNKHFTSRKLTKNMKMIMPLCW